MAQKYLVNIDLADNVLTNAKLHVSGTAPTAAQGQVWFDTGSDNCLKIHNGTSWIAADASKVANSYIPVTKLAASSITIGTTSVTLGNTALSLAGLQGLSSAAGAHNYNFSSSSGTFDTPTGTTTLRGNVTTSGNITFNYSGSSGTWQSPTGAITLNGDVTVAASKSITMNSGYTPTNDYHVATKIYVDNALQGLKGKQSVKFATTGSVNASSRTSTTLTLGGTSWTPDGTAVVNGDRVLVKDSNAGSGGGTWDNGIYVVSGVGSSVVLTRASDSDTWAELISAYVWIEEGSTNADSGWLCTVNAGGTLGTTAVTWVLFSSAGSLIAGNGLTKTGNTLDVNVDNSTIEINTDIVRVKDAGITHSKLASMTSAQFAGVISDETGSGSLVFATSPSLTTPSLGVATATSINKVAITSPATSATLTLADGSTLQTIGAFAVNMTATGATSITLPTSGTLATTSNNLSVFAATTSAQLAGVISDETGSGSLVFGTAPTITGVIRSLAASVSAAGTTQGTATAITNDYNVVTTAAANSGVILPAAPASGSRCIIVVNKGANPVNVYPATSHFIDVAAQNAAVVIPVNGVVEFNAYSSTQWWSTLQDPVSLGVVSGTLTPANGGTGFSTVTNVGELYAGNTTSTMTRIAPVVAGSVLVSNGTAAAPVWSASPSITTSVTVPVVQGQSGTGGTLTLRANGTDTTGTVTINSATINSSVASVTLFATPTTIAFGDAATSLTIGGTTSAQTVNIGAASTGASTYNIASGATLTATTKTLNIGTAGVSGSTTNINIGSTVTGATGTTTIGTSTVVIGNAASVTLQAVPATATTVNLMTGLSNASAKTINIGTGGSNGAITTNIGGATVKLANYTANGFLKTGSSDGTLSVDTGTYTKKYIQTLSTSATSYTVNHNLGTVDVVVQVYYAQSPFYRVMTDVEHTDANNITLRFAVAPTANDYKVVVIG
jgi:hypothetical protein